MGVEGPGRGGGLWDPGRSPLLGPSPLAKWGWGRGGNPSHIRKGVPPPPVRLARGPPARPRLCQAASPIPGWDKPRCREPGCGRSRTNQPGICAISPLRDLHFPVCTSVYPPPLVTLFWGLFLLAHSKAPCLTAGVRGVGDLCLQPPPLHKALQTRPNPASARGESGGEFPPCSPCALSALCWLTGSSFKFPGSTPPGTSRSCGLLGQQRMP